MTGLQIAVTSVTAPRADPAHPCGPADFAVVPYTGQPLMVPPGPERTLAELGVPAAQWPHLAMVDRVANQDGCKDATIGFDVTVQGG